ncbi:MAG: primosomal protein N' [Firmicutes bacterium]|nr:primosomal protein N' [Bacillota bacterium]
MKYISVAIENSVTGMDRLYTYACRDEDVRPGDCVYIPFGTSDGRRRGYVFEVKDKTEFDTGKIKEVIGVEKGLLSQEAVFLCAFMKERYLCRYIDGVKCFIPSGYFMYENILNIADVGLAEEFLRDPKTPKRQFRLVDVLLKNGPMKKSTLKNEFGIGYDVMSAVTKKGLTVQGKVERKRRPHLSIRPDPEKFTKLTEEQQKAFGELKTALESRAHKVFLIHGVTGSGKTRLYMETIKAAISMGKTAIVIVPEISLTVQAIEKYRGEFGEDNVAVIHSKLSEGEKYDEWMRIKRGEVKIVIGARSALFAPLKNIGVIVVDEEHESSYKADNSPKYDARELAEKRAEYNNGILVLGSATPSVKTYSRCESGEVEKLVLKHRYNSTPLPEISIVDMRKELIKGNKSIFSIKLYDEICRCLEEKKQIILFLNKRGYSSFVSCRKCGYVMRCPECGLSMTYHKSENAAVCHYCGRKEEMPKLCPECGGRYIKDFGIGTEKVEEITAKLFPKAKVARLDLDTVRKKGSAEQIISELKEGKTDILIGTQLVAKGHDFEGIGLVGIIAADISLNISDYRASENTFQLITQAAGRSGRGEERGKVVVQTYSPEHYSITAAASHDYESFYEEEKMIRKMMSYPPFAELIQLVFLDEDEDKALSCAEEFSRVLAVRAGGSAGEGIIGPSLSNISKIRGRYRYRVLIKYKDKDIEEFMKILEDMRSEFSYEKYRSTLIGIDIDPYSLV